MTQPYVLSPQNSVQMQSMGTPQTGNNYGQGGFQSFLNSLAPQQQGQRRKGILGGIQDVQSGLQSNTGGGPMGPAGGIPPALGMLSKFVL